VLRAEPNDVDGNGRFVRGCPAASADGPAGKKELRSETRDFPLPPGFFVKGKSSHVGEMLADPGVPLLELRQQLMAEAVASVGGVEVGGVFAPPLANFGEVRLDPRASDVQERTENAALGEMDDGMDAGEAFRPRATQKFAENGFGLVVERMGGGYGVDFSGCHELAKPAVAESPGGFFYGFSGFAGFSIPAGFGGGIDPMSVEREVEGACEIGGKLLVQVGFRLAQAVMEMGCVEYKAQLRASRGKGTGQGDGIRSAGQADGQAQARLQKRYVECRKRRCHWMMLNPAGNRMNAQEP
jgi:hypothetical protein